MLTFAKFKFFPSLRYSHTFASNITLCKIGIQKIINGVQGEQAQEQALELELSKKENAHKLRGSLIGFLICFALLILSLVAIWILGNID